MVTPGLFFCWVVAAPLQSRTGLESHPSRKDATSATGDARRPFGPEAVTPLPPTAPQTATPDRTTTAAATADRYRDGNHRPQPPTTTVDRRHQLHRNSNRNHNHSMEKLTTHRDWDGVDDHE